MAKIKQRVTRKGGFAVEVALPLPNSFWQAMGEAMVLAIVDNVVKQKRYDGTSQKTNKQTTLERKRRLGRPLVSLRDDPSKYRFATPSNYKVEVQKNEVDISLKAKHNAKNIAKYLQRDMGYTGWMRPARGVAQKVFTKMFMLAVKRAKAKVAKKTKTRTTKK